MTAARATCERRPGVPRSPRRSSGADITLDGVKDTVYIGPVGTGQAVERRAALSERPKGIVALDMRVQAFGGVAGEWASAAMHP